MDKTKIAFGVGIVVAVLVVLTASAAADNVFYFVPQNSNGASGEEITVWVMLNATNVTDAFDAEIYFDLDVVNITAWANPGSIWDWWDVGHHGNYVHIGGMDFGGGSSGVLGLANLTLKGNTTGVSSLHFDPGYTGCGYHGNPLPETLIDGTFTCIAPLETFSKDLVAGWNLISLPLTNATAMTVANIIDPSLGGSYDALFRYDAGTHAFVELASSADEMANCVGYFIHLTAADTWTYTGVAYTGMNVTLQLGLNMPGWLNCSKEVSNGLSSITGSYNYVARWNATSQKFETYNPVAPEVFNDFTTMERGEGYFISAKAAGTLNEAC